MSVLTLSGALMLIAIIIGLVFNGTVGILLGALAVLGMLYAFVSYAGSESTGQDEIDSHLDDVLKHNPRY
jgi:hypothetical protein